MRVLFSATWCLRPKIKHIIESTSTDTDVMIARSTDKRLAGPARRPLGLSVHHRPRHALHHPLDPVDEHVSLRRAALAVVPVGGWAPLIVWIGRATPRSAVPAAVSSRRAPALHHGRQRPDQHTRALDRRPHAAPHGTMTDYTERHLVPSIPFHRLPDADAARHARLGVLQRGYARWPVGFVRTLRP